jgi:hypothetical protein
MTELLSIGIEIYDQGIQVDATTFHVPAAATSAWYYSPIDYARAVEAAVQATYADFTLTYSATTNKFTAARVNPFTLAFPAAEVAQEYLGYSGALYVAAASYEADERTMVLQLPTAGLWSDRWKTQTQAALLNLRGLTGCAFARLHHAALDLDYQLPYDVALRVPVHGSTSMTDWMRLVRGRLEFGNRLIRGLCGGSREDDGVPSSGLLTYWADETDLTPARQWRVLRWPEKPSRLGTLAEHWTADLSVREQVVTV